MFNQSVRKCTHRGSVHRLSRIHVLSRRENLKLFMEGTKNGSNLMDNESNCPEIIREGKAEILLETEKNVFYNPVQEFNRDLSTAVLSLFAEERYRKKLETKTPECEEGGVASMEMDLKAGQKYEDGITILEALSATGLRSIRYAKEIPGVKQVTANDISARAVASIMKNVLHNKAEDLITISHDDATMVMYQGRRERFDAVDLDPYGCPSIFLDGAVQCVSEGGLLLVTATDMAVLAGNSPETCYVKYGAVSLKSKACHEMALRILLQHILAHAGRYGRYIQPLLSLSADFYIRVFVRVFTGQLKCKENTSKLGMVYQCVGCESVTVQPLGFRKSDGKYGLPGGPAVDQLCKHCQHRHRIGGPIWLGPLHDQVFVSNLLCKIDDMNLGTWKRLQGVLNVIHEELDVPLYYTLDRLMSIVRCHTPSMITFRSALLNAGYKVSYSHASRTSIKTDAPNDVIWDVVRAWERGNPSKKERLEANSPALAVLTAESTTEISLKRHPLANPISRQKGLSRFQENPTAYWGPGTRSTSMIDADKSISKKKRNQSKNHKNKRTERKKDERQSAQSKTEESTDEESVEEEPPVKQPRQDT